MRKFFIPTRSAACWRQLLADPTKQWKPSFSAMTAAQSWEAAAGGLPPEIRSLLGTGPAALFGDPELLLALPEYQVKLPGGSRPTQTDVFALVRGGGGLSACAIEAKVDEEFGPTIQAKSRAGATKRLAYLHELLEISPQESEPLRYQLFHRTAAAILLAQKFDAKAAVMLVQSFSPSHRWFGDFAAFARALGVSVERGRLSAVGRRGGMDLYLGWAMGDQKFRSDLSLIAQNQPSTPRVPV